MIRKRNEEGRREKRAAPGFLITPARHEARGYTRRTRGRALGRRGGKSLASALPITRSLSEAAVRHGACEEGLWQHVRREAQAPRRPAPLAR